MHGLIATRRASKAGSLFAAATLCLSLASAGSAKAGDSPYAFSLPSVAGGQVELSPASAPQFTVVVFVGVECPIAKLYAPRLQALADEFRERGIRVIGVGSNRQDSDEELRDFAQTHDLTFEICKDEGNVVADRYGAERITAVMLLDRALKIVYRGRIDDEFQPGLVRAAPRTDDLRQALLQALAGEAISVPRTEAVGCLIGREPSPPVSETPLSGEITYAGDVAAILQKHCVECHRPGEIGPFSLTDYEEIVGWGPTLVETVDAGRMPPWHAEPGHVRLANERVMTDAEKEILRKWVNAGMPLGDPTKLPPASEEIEDAVDETSAPDLIVKMSDRPFQVPASETVEYQYYVVDPGLEQDAWIAGAEVVPGDRSVVHHCIVFVRPPDGAEAEGIGWLSAYVPGQRSLPYPKGYARRIPARSKLVFQMHYTPTGTPAEDVTSIHLNFIDEADVTHELFTVAAIRSDFEIPPNAADHSIVASRGSLPKNGALLAAAPHMHLRGKSFALIAESGDERRTLLSVPRYDFNWQHVYAFEEPIPLADIDRLTADLRFDNSAGNPTNPDPSAFVYWGDQTDEEMAIGFCEIAVPRSATRTGDVASVAPPEAREDVRSDSAAYAAEYFRRFDADQDGRIVPDELPHSVANFGFGKLDADGNGELTAEEIADVHRKRSAR
ncbi:MAG TPA: redoxin domain-containing protein [Pirellulaceae bacterium]|nr:redoxin domain-containing protein [Pirellulaceae bacterium]